MNHGLRSYRATLWLAPAILFAYLHVNQTLTNLGGWSKTATAISTSTASVFLLAPAAAAVAAAQAGRLRRANVEGWAPRRARLVIVADAARPTFVTAAGALVGLVLVSMLRVGGSLGGWGLTAPAAVLSSLVVLAAGVAAGAALGLAVTGLVAVPSVLIASYLWFVWPIAIEPFWIRHVTGFRSSCCMVSSALAPGALVAPALLSTGALAGVAILLSRRPRLAVRVVAAAGAIAFAAIAARATVADLGPDPTIARTEGLQCTTTVTGHSTTPRTLCMWSDHESKRGMVVEALGRVDAALAGTTLHIESTLTESSIEPRGSQVFGISVDSTSVDVIGSVASAVVEPWCPVAAAPTQSVDLQSTLVTVVVLRSGVAPGDIEGRVDDASLQEALAVVSTPEPEQRQWITTAEQRLNECSASGRP